MSDVVVRFLVGGVVVSLFAVIGDLFKPKSFGGIFGAAPSVALATLSLTIAKHGGTYAAAEALSMMAGAFALAVYCQVVCWTMMRFKYSALPVTSAAVVLWFAVAFGIWAVLLR
ncbi:MAG: DUF3147 family protein [Verrucomicrobia bacterium]|nr:DUF3147 family protein [Verrucomicrobiota bacterium]